MTFYQKTLYFAYPINDFIVTICMPVLFAYPFACLVMNTCPYGMDRLLFGTHVVQLVMAFVCAVYYSDVSSVTVAISDQIGSRVLWFTSAKACINLIMVRTGWKNPGHFKYTPKASERVEASCASDGMPQRANGTCDLVMEMKGYSSTGSNLGSTEVSSGIAGPEGTAQPPCGGGPLDAPPVHAALSRVTEARRRVMPLGGTLDMWVLLAITAADLAAAAVGLMDLKDVHSSQLRWDAGSPVKMIAIVYAIIDAVPGLLFLGCAKPAKT